MATTFSRKKLSINELRWLRMRSQCLFPRRPKADLLQMIRSQVGVNAQLLSAMCLSLRARVEGITKVDIDELRTGRRLAVRTWCMRGTMHLLAAQDVSWLLSTLPDRLVADGWRWLERRAGLPLEKARQISDEAVETLKVNGPMTRNELVKALTPKYGPQAKAAAAGIVHLNGLLGRMCFGPDRGPEPTYSALETWLNVPSDISGVANYGELVNRFLQGYGPAIPKDLSTWWGGALSGVKKAWGQFRDECLHLDFEGQPLWMTAEPLGEIGSPDPVVRLLPAFDNYYLGYHKRDFAVPVEYQPDVFHGGEIVPVILLDGSTIGTWHYEQRGSQIRISARPFTGFTRQTCDLIAEEAADIGRFFQLEPNITFE